MRKFGSKEKAQSLCAGDFLHSAGRGYPVITSLAGNSLLYKHGICGGSSLVRDSHSWSGTHPLFPWEVGEPVPWAGHCQSTWERGGVHSHQSPASHHGLPIISFITPCRFTCDHTLFHNNGIVYTFPVGIKKKSSTSKCKTRWRGWKQQSKKQLEKLQGALSLVGSSLLLEKR